MTRRKPGRPVVNIPDALVVPLFAMSRQVNCEPDLGNQFYNGLAPEFAKRICERCAVQEKCLDWAIEHGEKHGVWGGMTPDERKAEAERRNGRAAA